MTVDEGSLCRLVGHNGAGKTTTLRSITGIQNPRLGTITFKETDITKNEPHATSQAGSSIIPEHRRVFPGFTVEENHWPGHIGHEIDQPRGGELTDCISLMTFH